MRVLVVPLLLVATVALAAVPHQQLSFDELKQQANALDRVARLADAAAGQAQVGLLQSVSCEAQCQAVINPTLKAKCLAECRVSAPPSATTPNLRDCSSAVAEFRAQATVCAALAAEVYAASSENATDLVTSFCASACVRKSVTAVAAAQTACPNFLQSALDAAASALVNVNLQRTICYKIAVSGVPTFCFPTLLKLRRSSLDLGGVGVPTGAQVAEMCSPCARAQFRLMAQFGDVGAVSAQSRARFEMYCFKDGEHFCADKYRAAAQLRASGNQTAFYAEVCGTSCFRKVELAKKRLGVAGADTTGLKGVCKRRKDDGRLCASLHAQFVANVSSATGAGCPVNFAGASCSSGCQQWLADYKQHMQCCFPWALRWIAGENTYIKTSAAASFVVNQCSVSVQADAECGAIAPPAQRVRMRIRKFVHSRLSAQKRAELVASVKASIAADLSIRVDQVLNLTARVVASGSASGLLLEEGEDDTVYEGEAQPDDEAQAAQMQTDANDSQASCPPVEDDGKNDPSAPVECGYESAAASDGATTPGPSGEDGKSAATTLQVLVSATAAGLAVAGLA